MSDRNTQERNLERMLAEKFRRMNDIFDQAIRLGGGDLGHTERQEISELFAATIHVEKRFEDTMLDMLYNYEAEGEDRLASGDVAKLQGEVTALLYGLSSFIPSVIHAAGLFGGRGAVTAALTLVITSITEDVQSRAADIAAQMDENEKRQREAAEITDALMTKVMKAKP